MLLIQLNTTNVHHWGNGSFAETKVWDRNLASFQFLH